MWGMGSWKDSDDAASAAALERAVDLGCNFFDTAFAYGDGHSERLLGALVRARAGGRGSTWRRRSRPRTSGGRRAPESALGDVFPPDHIRAYLERSLENLGVPAIDLVQLHVWSDGWAEDESWQRALDEAKREGLVRGVGISVNRWESDERRARAAHGRRRRGPGHLQRLRPEPRGRAVPAVPQLDVAVIARVPFDEGTLTGKLTRTAAGPRGTGATATSRRRTSRPRSRASSACARWSRRGSTMADLALRFALASPAVSTVIPGMRQLRNVDANLAASDGRALPAELRTALRAHRWDRGPSR